MVPEKSSDTTHLPRCPTPQHTQTALSLPLSSPALHMLSTARLPKGKQNPATGDFCLTTFLVHLWSSARLPYQMQGCLDHDAAQTA